MLKLINQSAFLSPKSFDWARRHNNAVMSPRRNEVAALALFDGFLTFLSEFDQGLPVAEDYVLGPKAESMAKTCLWLLNHDLGKRLDMGTLDLALRTAMKDAGFTGGDWDV